MPNTDIQPSGNADADGAANARIVYILYLCGIVLWPVAVVGVVMSYVNRNEAAEWVASHYRFQIRSFWIGLLFGTVCVATVIFVVGYFLLFVALVWWIVRCVKGLKYLANSEPHPNAATWLW